MQLKSRIEKELRSIYGSEFESYLEMRYKEIILKHLMSGDIELQAQWLTYNQVLVEIKNVIKDELRTKELLYMLTDDGLPNVSCVKIIDKMETINDELVRLRNKIINF